MKYSHETLFGLLVFLLLMGFGVMGKAAEYAPQVGPDEPITLTLPASLHETLCAVPSADAFDRGAGQQMRSLVLPRAAVLDLIAASTTSVHVADTTGAK